jgi:hypothetical protein
VEIKMEISKKQSQLYQDIISQEKPKISVLGSAQSGKTFIISLATIKYAIELSKYDNSKTYYGAIVGWSVDTLKRNICNVMEGFLNQMGLKRKEIPLITIMIMIFSGELVNTYK